MPSNYALKFFRYGATNLLETMPDELRRKFNGRLKVVLRDSEAANTVAMPRTFGFLGYEVRVNKGWYQFISDIADFLTARSELRAPADDTILAFTTLSKQDAASILKEITSKYIETQKWLSANVLLKAASAAITTDFQAPRETLFLLKVYIGYFTIAHELGHIIAGHFSRTHPQSIKEQWEQEFEADEIGITLLVNLLAQRKDFGSYPRGYLYGYVYVTTEDLMVVIALQAVALMLTLIDLWQQAAESLGKDGWHSHPPGRLRYLKLRDFCIKSDIIRKKISFAVAQVDPDRLFSASLTGFGSPDHVQQMFQYMALDIVWTTDSAASQDRPYAIGDVQLDEVWEQTSELKTKRIELDRSRRHLDDEVTKDQDNIPNRALLTRVLTTLAAICIRLNDPNDATVYLRAALHHLWMLRYDEIDTSAEESMIKAVNSSVVAAMVWENTEGLDSATHRLRKIYDLLQNPRKIQKQEVVLDERVMLMKRLALERKQLETLNWFMSF